MRTIITLIELLCSIVAWGLFGLLVATGIQWLWNATFPILGLPRIDMFTAALAYLIIFALWLIFAKRPQWTIEKAEKDKE